MFRRSCLLSAIMIAAGSTVAVSDEPEARPVEIPGWGRAIDPWRDCSFTVHDEDGRLSIRVPGTPHVLSAEVPRLPMNAPRVLRGVRGDFTARVHVVGRLEPGPNRTTHYDPYHGAGLIVWQDPSNYLRLERAVGVIKGRDRPYINYELREGDRLAVTRGFAIPDGPLFLRLQRQAEAFTAGYSRDGFRWINLGRIDTTFSERVEAGVVAVNSSDRTLSAELEMWNLEDARSSMARDYAGHDPVESSRPLPPSAGSPPVRPRPVSVLFDPSPARKPLDRPPPPGITGRDGFHW